LRLDAEGADHAERPLLVFVGDYIDRGQNSREVIELILAWMIGGPFEVCALLGNHDQFMLTFLEEPEVGPAWAKVGGLATLQSYGVDPPKRDDPESWAQARDQLRQALPATHLAFLRALPLYRIEGEYLFVHAGVRPGTPLTDQAERDLLWIREPFLSATTSSGYVVIHGHTPAPNVEVSALRIGIDTGAYATGVLSAIRLWGGKICTFTTRR
jgi:serine/threonine protein phosphatase 1